jgi:hypothetical protein
MRSCFSHTTNSGVELWVVDVASAKRLNLPKTKSTLTLETLLAGIATTKILVRMLPKNRAALLNEKKNLPTGPLFQMQPAQFLKTGPIKIY